MDEEIAEIPQICSFFNLGQPIRIMPIKEGISNHNYLVDTAEGDFVLKFLVGQTAVSVQNDLAIQQQLTSAGLKTPQYLRSKENRYVYEHGDRTAVIAKKLDGNVPRTMNPQLAFSFGRTLATFHQSITTVPQPNPQSLMNPATSGVPSKLFSYDLPKGIIHGDFHLGNALVNDEQNEIIAILDFEETSENLFLVDLATTIMAICVTPNENILDRTLIRNTISGYQSVREMSQAEQSLLPDALTYAANTWIRWFVENNFNRYAQNHRERLKSLPNMRFSVLDK